MMSTRPCYFLAPTRDCPPNGPIVIGSIIDNLSEPEQPVSRGKPVAFLDGDRTWTTVDENWRWERSSERDASGGIFTKFLQMIGIGVDLEIALASGRYDAFEVEKLTTIHFNPSRGYIEKSIADPHVKACLTAKPHEPLWMITGIKIASGAKIISETLRSRGVHVQVGVDTTALGVPLDFGPKLSDSRTTKVAESAKPSEDFVFAYRLREIRFRRRGGMICKDHTNGAFFDLGESSTVEEVALNASDLVSGGEDISIEDIEGLQQWQMTDEENVLCVLPEGFVV